MGGRVLEQMSPSKIDISAEDLTQAEPNYIEITADELSDDALFAGGIVKSALMSRRYDTSALIKKGLLAGAAGGILAWLFGEGVLLVIDGISHTSNLGLAFSTGFWAAAIGAAISVVLALGEGLYAGTRLPHRTVAKAIGIGGVGGYFGGFIGQLVYGSIARNSSFFMQVLVRALGWAVVGLAIGLAYGALAPNKRRIRNSLVGGLIGGAIGGALFDPIAAFAQIGDGQVSRTIAIMMLGAAVGLAISMIEQVAKDSWLQVIRGAFEGKEFILYEPRTVIGSGHDCSINLFKDDGVSPKHAEIRVEGAQTVIHDLRSAAGTRVNGEYVRSRVIRNGDVIKIGEAAFVFREILQTRA